MWERVGGWKGGGGGWAARCELKSPLGLWTIAMSPEGLAIGPNMLRGPKRPINSTYFYILNT